MEAWIVLFDLSVVYSDIEVEEVEEVVEVLRRCAVLDVVAVVVLCN